MLTPVILRKKAVGCLVWNQPGSLTQQVHWHESSATRTLGDPTYWKFNIDAKK